MEYPHNMNYTYGRDLKEVPEDAVAMKKGLDWLLEKLESTPAEDKVELIKVNSQISNFARILGNLDLAETCIVDAISLLKEFDREDQVFAMNLRLGAIYHYQKNYIKAEEVFSSSLKAVEQGTISKIGKYSDFILYSYGKLKFEQGFFKEALDLFLAAYEQRLIKGDLELISATDFAIAETRKHL